MGKGYDIIEKGVRDLRSKEVLKRPEFSMHRAAYKSMGYSDDDLSRPIIGIANSWNTIVPGHFNLRLVSEFVKRGIYRGGGTAVEFGVIAACDGVAQGHDGMHYILPSRELIANDVEVMAQAHRFDGLVLLGSCDKIVPGMLMAAARLDIPAIIVPGGPMSGGIEFDERKADLTSVSEALGMMSTGKISEEEYHNLEDVACPGCGSCAFFGTANTMCSLAEAFGMTLPGGALTPATYAERLRIAQESGIAICELVKKNISARKIINKASLENAIRVCMATGGSTNAALHLPAIAYEAGLSLNVLEMFDSLSRTTPQIAKVNPASKWDMEAFFMAGGIPRVMEKLGDLINRDALTCTGRTVAENLANYRYHYPEDKRVIRDLSDPFNATGGLAVLHGNLAPDGAVCKPGAMDPSVWHFKGKAMVFDNEESADKAILDGKVGPGTVVVIRYEGPKGGPGMREMYNAMKYLYGRGLALSTALVTDGRFSGTNNGCFVGHISPEAAEGGPLAIVKDGDEITIDVEKRELTLHVSDEEIKRRLAQWKRPEPKIKTGYLALYSKLASSASQGAIFKF